MRIAVIGAGVSGMTVAHCLKERHDVTVFERDSKPGGLIKCRRTSRGLFHTCGGHVFNTKRKDVLDWFWRFFDCENEFIKTDRNSTIYLEDGLEIPYPIENYIYLLPSDTQKRIIKELLDISHQDIWAHANSKSFESYLINRFGKTLFELYFRPYNAKVWRRDLKDVPIDWLEGKLPMPTVDEMIYNNFNHVREKGFVHSTFWYPKEGGSQFLADRMSKDLCINYNTIIDNIHYQDGSWWIKGEAFDRVVFCGNIKDLILAVTGVELSRFRTGVNELEYHGTTSVFCEIDNNPYTWIYQPSANHDSHRIICTGNFSVFNNGTQDGRITATVEFTDEIEIDRILQNLGRMPFHPTYIDHVYNQYTYPIQSAKTRDLILTIKQFLAPFGLFFTGRFADWEYYNMDAAMGAAMDLSSTIS